MGGATHREHDEVVLATALLVDQTLSTADVVGADTRRGGRDPKGDCIKEDRVKGMSRRKCHQGHRPKRSGCED